MSNDHWDEIYTVRADRDLGWYEASSATLDDVVELASDPLVSVLDVGGGTSRLVDELLAKGYVDLTILDISVAAIRATRERLAVSAGANSVDFITGDVTDFKPDRTWRLWHDRAVFHFLVDEADRAGYLAGIDRALEPGGFAVVATFAEAGPESCAGLPVHRYSEDDLAAELDAVLECTGCRTTTVGDADTDRRPYTICQFRKR